MPHYSNDEMEEMYNSIMYWVKEYGIRKVIMLLGMVITELAENL